MRIMIAIGCSPRRSAGTTTICRFCPRSSHGDTHLRGGTQRKTVELISKNIVASQKAGNESPIRPNRRVKRSEAPLRRTADMIPRGMATIQAKKTAITANWMVTGMLRIRLSLTDSPVRIETPASPRASPPTHSPYWTTIGLLSPILSRIWSIVCWLTCGSPPKRISTMSPGSRRSRMKTISDVPIRVGITSARR